MATQNIAQALKDFKRGVLFISADMVKAIRAASLLKQACTEVALIGGAA